MHPNVYVKKRETMCLREQAQTSSDVPGTGNIGWPLGKEKGAGVYGLDGHFSIF